MRRTVRHGGGFGKTIRLVATSLLDPRSQGCVGSTSSAGHRQGAVTPADDEGTSTVCATKAVAAWRRMVPMRAHDDRPEPRRVSPGEHPMWEQALALLNRDLAATLPEQNLCDCWPFHPTRPTSRRTSTSLWPMASGTAITCTRSRRWCLPLRWRSSPMPHRRQSPSVCGRRGLCAPSTAWGCIRGMRTGSCPGGARGSGRGTAGPTSVRPWAGSTPSSVHTAPTVRGGGRGDVSLRPDR